MKERDVALVVFVGGKDVVVQERGKHSKVGEKYGFWGGEIEKGETKEEAIKRELKEELGFVPDKLEYLGKYPYVVKETSNYKGWRINQVVFISPINSQLMKANKNEGEGLVRILLEEALKGEGFPIGSTYFLEELRKQKT
jgi:mutator protein MutT